MFLEKSPAEIKAVRGEKIFLLNLNRGDFLSDGKVSPFIKVKIYDFEGRLPSRRESLPLINISFLLQGANFPSEIRSPPS